MTPLIGTHELVNSTCKQTVYNTNRFTDLSIYYQGSVFSRQISLVYFDVSF